MMTGGTTCGGLKDGTVFSPDTNTNVTGGFFISCKNGKLYSIKRASGTVSPGGYMGVDDYLGFRVGVNSNFPTTVSCNWQGRYSLIGGDYAVCDSNIFKGFTFHNNVQPVSSGNAIGCELNAGDSFGNPMRAYLISPFTFWCSASYIVDAVSYNGVFPLR